MTNKRSYRKRNSYRKHMTTLRKMNKNKKYQLGGNIEDFLPDNWKELYGTLETSKINLDFKKSIFILKDKKVIVGDKEYVSRDDISDVFDIFNHNEEVIIRIHIGKFGGHDKIRKLISELISELIKKSECDTGYYFGTSYAYILIKECVNILDDILDKIVLEE